MNLTERYFRALGWVTKGEGRNSKMMKAPMWWNGEECEGTDLPYITTHFPAFKFYVLEEMEKQGFKYMIYKLDGNCAWKWWKYVDGNHQPYALCELYCEAIIKGNEILSAAIEASCELLEKEREYGR